MPGRYPLAVFIGFTLLVGSYTRRCGIFECRVFSLGSFLEVPHRLRWEMIQKLASSIRGHPSCLVERTQAVNIDGVVGLSKG